MNLADRILFIDDDAIVIDKPAGLPVDTPKRGGDSVAARLDELRCGKGVPTPMHRLDQDTSGCLLLARNKKARVELQQAFENETVVKYYLAVIDAEVAEEDGTIDLPLSKHSTREAGWRMIVDPKGQEASTKWVRLKVRGGRTLVRFEPKTGRTHQIRIHAREAFGAGIVGDPVYGSGEGPMLLHASRLSIARDPWSQKYDIHAEAPLPEHFGDWRIDPDEVERDREAMKAAFTYRDVSRDRDKGLEDLDRPIFAADLYGGFGPYWKFQQFVIDCYHEKGALEPLVKMYSGHRYPVSPALDRLLNDLVAADRPDLMERLWSGITRRSRAAFLAESRGTLPGEIAMAERLKEHALDAYADAIKWLKQAKTTVEVVNRFEEERRDVLEGRRPELPPVSDLRKIDETVFWQLIARSRSDGRETGEQVAVLEELLRSFGATDIKKFGSLYAKYMRRLYHWNVWALAYAALGGCSDDSFMDFRSWLILQGEPDLIELAIEDPARAAARVPAEADIPDGTLLATIEDAYFARAGTSVEMPMMDLEQPKGREWPEERFEEWFPELVRHYDAT